jgi:hypothetical protein
VPPGQEGKIELAVEHTDGYQGEVAKSAGVTTNDSKYATFNLTLRARFKVEPPPGSPNAPGSSGKRATIMVEPVDRWMTSVIVGNNASTNFYVVNNGGAPFHIKKIEPSGPEFTASFQPIQDGQRYELALATSKALKPGEYHRTLRILTDSTVMPEVTILLDMNVFPRVFVSPTTIIMPTLPSTADLGAINWPMVSIRKLQSTGLKINKFSSTLPFLKLDLLTEKEGEFYQIRMVIDSTKIKPGDFKGVIHIETNEPSALVLDVPVSGRFNP